MALLFSVLYLLVFLWAGLQAARWVLVGGSLPEQLSLSCCFGLAMLEAFPALAALVLGFHLSAVLLAALPTLALGLIARRKTKGCRSASSGDGRPFALCTVPFLLLAGWLLHTHILCPTDGELWTGQSCYGDLAMHLAFIKSIAVQGCFPPAYPLLAGQTLFGYPFLCESVSSVFVVLGADLRTAYILPAAVAMAAVFGCLWLLARRALGSAAKASLAYWLFFCGSGFGFVYFLDSPAHFKSIFTGYYTTPTNFVEKNIRWVNPLADLLIPQRATLFGWALLFGCLYLLWRFAFEQETRLWLPLALLAGCLPLVHTHSLLALVLICGVLFFRAVLQAFQNRALIPLLPPWLLFAAVAGVLVCPQLFGIIFQQTGGGSNFLRFHFNWANDGDNYFWFYIKNIGVVWLLAVPAFLHADKSMRWLYGGGLLILVLAEFVVFQPNTYDNNKLLFVWHLLGCLLAANLIGDFPRLFSPRALGCGAAAAAVFLGTFGSVLTLGREAVSRYQLFGKSDIAAAAYIEENAPSDALFCTGTHHLNPVATLAGRSILCGSSLYVYFHGMHYGAQQMAVQALYESPSEELLREWDVDYVSFSRWERGNYRVDEDFYHSRYPVWYQNSDYTIYAIQ